MAHKNYSKVIHVNYPLSVRFHLRQRDGNKLLSVDVWQPVLYLPPFAKGEMLLPIPEINVHHVV